MLRSATTTTTTAADDDNNEGIPLERGEVTGGRGAAARSDAMVCRVRYATDRVRPTTHSGDRGDGLSHARVGPLSVISNRILSGGGGSTCATIWISVKQAVAADSDRRPVLRKVRGNYI